MTAPVTSRITYVSWAPHCSRSDHTARELGGTSHMIYWGWLGSRPATVWLKYLGQTFSTWRVLKKESPDAVFVMSPSPVAVLAVFIYCRLSGTPFIIDAHSGAFQNPRWKALQSLQYWLCRRARTTIVTNAQLASLVTSRGGRAVIVPDVPVRFPLQAGPEHRASFFVVCATSFGHDEPIEAIIEAARHLPDVTFYMTGNPSGARNRLTDRPPNVVLTGFLDTERYGQLLRDAGAVLALTTIDHTMQRGAYEAVYQGTPVIVSDFDILRTAFDEGAVHVDNTPESIVRAVKAVRQEEHVYRAAVRRLERRKLQRWQENRSALLAALDGRPREVARNA